MTNKVNKEIERKMQNTTRALVKKYGEGAVVTSNQIKSVIKSLKAKKTKTVHPTYIVMNPAYRVGRNQFLVTSAISLDAWNNYWNNVKAKKNAAKSQATV